MAIEAGAIVEYYDQRALLCALVVEVRKNQVNLLTETGRDARIAVSRVVAAFGRIAPGLARDRALEELRGHSRRRAELAAQVAVEELWELAVPDGQPIEPRLAAELVFGAGAGPDAIAAAARALRQDRLRFREEGGGFRPFPPDEVERNLARERRRAEQERALDAAAGWLRRVWEGERAPSPDPTLVPLLRSLTLEGSDSPEARRGKELLARTGLAASDLPFELMVRLGEWDEDENLTALRLELPSTFPADVLAEAEEVATRPLDPAGRVDLTALATFTIDGPWSEDFDDALSLEPAGDGQRLFIHISDVAATVPRDSRLDQEARARGTTIYTPDARWAMLPERISHGTLSLVAGAARRALTLEVGLDAAGQIVEHRLYPSLIRVGRRLSYDEADGLIGSGDPVLAGLHGLALALREQRRRRGAIIQVKPELEVRVLAGKQIWVKRHAGDSPAQAAVAEAMILANGLTGETLADAGVPGIFRSQPAPETVMQSMEPFDPLLHYQQRKLMPRADVSASPGPHSGLGLRAYVNVTSPIRRYGDLALQRQILAHLSGAPLPYTEEELEALALELRALASRAALVEQDRHRYWLLKHLAGERGRVFEAVVLDRQTFRTVIYLPELALEADLARGVPGEIRPGERLKVRLERADPRAGSLRLAVA